MIGLLLGYYVTRNIILSNCQNLRHLPGLKRHLHSSENFRCVLNGLVHDLMLVMVALCQGPAWVKDIQIKKQLSNITSILQAGFTRVLK
ncbi:hypothetical protein F2P79_010053 [Pimephales promelas]|nr:hypothetical protein F2P79_010053 [Pimephales promelas]